MKAAMFCGGGSCPCPHVYETDRGTYLVQGYRVPASDMPSDVVLADDEHLVEVPASLLEEFVAKRTAALV